MNRSYKKELLDGDNIPFTDIRQNMRELDFINTHLGGHAITIQGFKQLLQNKKNVSVCEIGCGGGDNLVAIYDWCNKNKVSIRVTGIDNNKNCIAIAINRLPATHATFITADYKTVDLKNDKPDIIFCSLFCHHFSNDEVISMLRWMQANGRLGFFINDLHRHFLAFYSIKILTSLFSKSYLVKNDAPLSVQRGLIKNEWMSLLEQSGVVPYTIAWKWAFRWLIISKHS